jgi:hypothetical protein
MPPATRGYGWLIAEDHAMKNYLKGLTVTDANAPPEGRPVRVWYRQPEQEAVERTYPYVTIDLVDINEANERASVNRLKVRALQYTPPDPLPAQIEDHTLVAERPVPVDLYYQITVVARSAIHDRQLQAALWRKFPGKWGALYVPNDETARTMQLTGATSASDIDPDGKRTFRRIYTVSVASELWPTVMKDIQNMETINISIEDVTDPSLTLSILNCDSE